MIGREIKTVSRILLIIFIILLSGCSAQPEVSEVSDVIVLHFEKRGYSVPELEIEKIENIPIRDRKYMSTKGHLVHIRFIRLQPAGQEAADVVTFSKSIIEIHRSPDELLGWVITRITGIPVL